MTKARLRELQSLDEVARAVGIRASRIVAFADAKQQSKSFDLHAIPKRGARRRGQYRHVYKAKKEWLAQLHRSIAMIVENSAEFEDHVQGFVKGRSIYTNAQRHLGARELLHADITNFFDSITSQQVKLGLLSIGGVPDVADVLARACSIDGYLRQGTRCSPALANLVCRKLDMELLSLAESTGSVYSRYADDITFSGDSTPAAEAVALILEQNGFALRDGRCYVQRQGRGQFVTGLSISDPSQPRLPRRLKRRLRLVAHYVERFGLDAHFAHKPRKAKAPLVSRTGQLYGMLAFVNAIEPDLAKKLYAKVADKDR